MLHPEHLLKLTVHQPPQTFQLTPVVLRRIKNKKKKEAETWKQNPTYHLKQQSYAVLQLPS